MSRRTSRRTSSEVTCSYCTAAEELVLLLLLVCDVGPLTRDAASAAGSAMIWRETEEADGITRDSDLGRGEHVVRNIERRSERVPAGFCTCQFMSARAP